METSESMQGSTAMEGGQMSSQEAASCAEATALLIRLVHLSLSLGMHSTALFLSERFSCLHPRSEEAVFLHALSLLRCNEARQALELLRSSMVDIPAEHQAKQGFMGGGHRPQGRGPACESSVRCAYVYAECCAVLERPNEGQELLRRTTALRGPSSGQNRPLIPERSAYPTNSSTYSVSVNLSLARLAVQANKPDVAAQKYSEALKAAWWCWEAYEGLCELGKAPDSNTAFPSIAVPKLKEPPDSATEAHPLAFGMGSAPIRSSRSASSIPPEFHRPLQSPALSGSTATPANNPIASTSQFPFGNFSFQARQPSASAAAVPPSQIATPALETQGAAFKFGEGLAEAGQGGIGGGLSVSMDESGMNGMMNESSFFGAGPTKQAKFDPGLGAGEGGLFGLGGKAGPAVPGKAKKPMFGTGLLFGSAVAAGRKGSVESMNGDTAQSGTGGSAQEAASAGGSFFTPVNFRAASTSLSSADSSHVPVQAFGRGRPPPAIKRAREQVDRPEAVPAFQLPGQRKNGAGRSNGMTAAGAEGDLFAEQQAGEEGVHDTIDGEEEDDGEMSSVFYGAGAAKAANLRKGSLNTRRSTRLNTTSVPPIQSSHPPGQQTTVAGGLFAKGKAANGSGTARIVTNPRDRKRSRAGPTNFYDDTATNSSSAQSIDSIGGVSPGYSSPPLSGGAHLEVHNPEHQLHSAPPSRSNSLQALQASASSTASTGQQRPLSAQQQRQAYLASVAAQQRAIAENWLRCIYRGFGKAYEAMSKYECTTAIKAVLELPPEQQRCPRAILLLGQAHFESLNYEKANQAYSSVREMAPFRVDGMEIYSTLLWHLHRPTQLSFLAQELMSISVRLPHAWIATGNVFSHLEDHPNALKCFKRAIQVDPSFVYSYTLAGHECVTMEEWDTASTFFREAIRRSPRHYNAWFGLGNVYMKTGKFRMAEYHFARATEINPTNAMLVCCVGTVLERLHRKKEALAIYETACLLAPTSPAVRFKRVRVLMELRQYESALRDLLIVRDLAPDEFNVHYLLGKLYSAMGDKANMTKSLTYAQDLEPRAAGKIREVIENADGKDGSDEDDEEADEEEREGMSE